MTIKYTALSRVWKKRHRLDLGAGGQLFEPGAQFVGKELAGAARLRRCVAAEHGRRGG